MGCFAALIPVMANTGICRHSLGSGVVPAAFVAGTPGLLVRVVLDSDVDPTTYFASPWGRKFSCSQILVSHFDTNSNGSKYV